MEKITTQNKYSFRSWLDRAKNDFAQKRRYFGPARDSQHLLNPESDITVFINVWRRDHLVEQISAIMAQTYLPKEIWILQCCAHVDIALTVKKFPFVHVISSSVNLKYFGRFSLSMFVQTDFLFIIDDDVIPGPYWLSTCRDLCKRKRAVIASAGRIIPAGDFQPESLQNVKRHFIADVDDRYSFNFCEAETKVDFGCNSWFLNTSWIQEFWRIPPYTLETGEDIHLSASLSILKGIDTIVPHQPDAYYTGNLKKSYGQDNLASWKKQDFLSLREHILKHLIIEKGWQPIQWQKAHSSFFSDSAPP